jgi:hypothetical protein
MPGEIFEAKGEIKFSQVYRHIDIILRIGGHFKIFDGTFIKSPEKSIKSPEKNVSDTCSLLC